MTLQEYNNLPDEDRQQADLKMLEYERSKEPVTEQPEPIEQNIEEESDIPNRKTEAASLIDAIVLSGYDINSYSLSAIQKQSLDNIVEIMDNEPELELLISGHTCILGPENVNYNVGRKRAETAKEYLVSKGIDESRINIESLGYSNPADDNSTPQGRNHNRRITFKIINK